VLVFNVIDEAIVGLGIGTSVSSLRSSKVRHSGAATLIYYPLLNPGPDQIVNNVHIVFGPVGGSGKKDVSEDVY
jgi:hypothetical protein